MVTSNCYLTARKPVFIFCWKTKHRTIRKKIRKEKKEKTFEESVDLSRNVWLQQSVQMWNAKFVTS